ncbi:uncharacterized protein LOC124420370 [Lucilia cuprina]|uniref:uncharacterized protein LOC124420370 n=1 Tax=Lucilia cuprina TaxID=7375 RepID=UPI001F06CB32|nr:uncharacterized protein LOC124420370 [Lucilia cuprina]
MVKYHVEIVKTENGKGKPTAGLTTALVAENGNDNADANGRENGTTAFTHYYIWLNVNNSYLPKVPKHAFAFVLVFVIVVDVNIWVTSSNNVCFYFIFVFLIFVVMVLLIHIVFRMYLT